MIKNSFNFKNFHLGSLIQQKVQENNIEHPRICKFLKCTEDQLKEMYISDHLDTDILLRWSKLLEYDFFRIYSQHLILYAPPGGAGLSQIKKPSTLPEFRKNIYTREIIDFILEMIDKGEKTMPDVMKEYGISKSTLHSWTKKYKRK
ncbi:transposase [Chryseobacterium potabilaquae]|uniref:Uncharacterized protein n=1 Tax=Chryseobacterium potabilaquae TaxID=2675057 RepID=A0A6N4XAF4_9FLAO|nr:transposase [Chryseobacterium potabilaquae]CAA7196681.1 hypothetical protein CHRY9293_02757 [Chryseobacterium potabilaquae]